jgi:quercetin dioxygenase-like cupin family protein
MEADLFPIEKIAGGILFTPQADPGFTPKTPEGLDNTGVKLHMTLGQARGDAITVAYGTIEAGCEIDCETHEWTESIYVIAGEATCTIGSSNPVKVSPGQVWHVEKKNSHIVKNLGSACRANAYVS